MDHSLPGFEYRVTYRRYLNSSQKLPRWSLQARATWGDREYIANCLLSYSDDDIATLRSGRLEPAYDRIAEAMDALRNDMRRHYDDAIARLTLGDFTEAVLRDRGASDAAAPPQKRAPGDCGHESLRRARSVPPGDVFSAPTPIAPPPPPKPDLPPLDLYEVESDQEEDATAEPIEVPDQLPAGLLKPEPRAEDAAAEPIEAPDRSTWRGTTKGDGEVAAEPDPERGDDLGNVIRTALTSAASYVDAYVRQSPDQTNPDEPKPDRERGAAGRFLKAALAAAAEAADAYVKQSTDADPAADEPLPDEASARQRRSSRQQSGKSMERKEELARRRAILRGERPDRSFHPKRPQS